MHAWESKQASLELSLITGQKGAKLRLAGGGVCGVGDTVRGYKVGSQENVEPGSEAHCSSESTVVPSHRSMNVRGRDEKQGGD